MRRDELVVARQFLEEERGTREVVDHGGADGVDGSAALALARSGPLVDQPSACVTTVLDSAALDDTRGVRLACARDVAYLADELRGVVPVLLQRSGQRRVPVRPSFRRPVALRATVAVAPDAALLPRVVGVGFVAQEDIGALDSTRRSRRCLAACRLVALGDDPQGFVVLLRLPLLVRKVVGLLALRLREVGCSLGSTLLPCLLAVGLLDELVGVIFCWAVARRSGLFIMAVAFANTVLRSGCTVSVFMLPDCWLVYA